MCRIRDQRVCSGSSFSRRQGSRTSRVPMGGGAGASDRYRMERRGASETGHVQCFQRAWLDILALKSSTLERKSFRIGDLFALL
jgi:hypothetical protein